jgi:hypothetical protein
VNSRGSSESASDTPGCRGIIGEPQRGYPVRDQPAGWLLSRQIVTLPFCEHKIRGDGEPLRGSVLLLSEIRGSGDPRLFMGNRSAVIGTTRPFMVFAGLRLNHHLQKTSIAVVVKACKGLGIYKLQPERVNVPTEPETAPPDAWPHSLPGAGTPKL